jgi:hypothetical protein
MGLPTPYGNANKEIAPLLKGIPKPRTIVPSEYIQYRIFDNRRLVYEGPVSPIKGFPETKVIIYARSKRWIRCFFTLESWRRDRTDVVWQSVYLPVYVVQMGVRYKVVIPGVKTSATGKQVVPAAVRIARRRVDAIRKNSIRRDKSFPRSSNLRPSTEIKTTTVEQHNEGNNGGYFFTNSSSTYNSYVRSWTGVRTPNFGRLKKQQLPVNPHTVSIVEAFDMYGAKLSFIPSTGIFFNVFGAYSALSYPVPSSVTHNAYAEFKAIRKLIEHAESGIEGNLAQDIVQIGQTTRLITNTCKRLVKSVTALKHGNIPGAVRALWDGHMPRYNGRGPSLSKSLASNWLELQYGWKPLIQDVRASMEALKRLNSASGLLVHRVTGSARVQTTTDSPIISGVGTNGRIGTHSLSAETRVKIVLRYKIDDKLKAFLQQTGFTNPINLGWEIVPFSFVVDWFIPIGPYLETLSSWDGLVFQDGSKTTFTRGVQTSIVDASETFSGINYEHHARYRRQTVLLDRVKLLTFPTTKMPTGFKNGLASVTHATNALALLRAAFR